MLNISPLNSLSRLFAGERIRKWRERRRRRRMKSVVISYKHEYSGPKLQPTEPSRPHHTERLFILRKSSAVSCYSLVFLYNSTAFLFLLFLLVEAGLHVRRSPSYGYLITAIISFDFTFFSTVIVGGGRVGVCGDGGGGGGVRACVRVCVHACVRAGGRVGRRAGAARA